MAHEIKLTVADHAIAVDRHHAAIVGDSVEHYTLHIDFDEEWTDVYDVFVTFQTGEMKPVGPIDYVDGMTIPAEVIKHSSNGLRFGITGVSKDGNEVIRTKHMKFGTCINPSSAYLGVEQQEKAKDIVVEAKERLAELESAIPTVEADWQGVKSDQAAQFASAQNARSKAFSDGMADWGATAANAAQNANEAAFKAEGAANDLASRVEAGEFNGTPFRITYTPASIAAMNAITGMKQGEFACITSNVQDPDNSKLFMFGNGVWNYITDMSGATGLQGPQGIQGPAGHTPTSAEVAAIAAPIVKGQLDSRVIVISKADYDALTEYADGVVYLVVE